MPGDVVTLFRPVGPSELRLIRDTGWRSFPPRLPEQPIFYPVTNLEYAVQIARDWNVTASGAGFASVTFCPACTSNTRGWKSPPTTFN